MVIQDNADHKCQACWKSRLRIMSGLKKFIAVDNYASVKIGDLQKETKSKKVVKPGFTADFPGAVIFDEGADKLTLRAPEESVLRTFIDTRNVGNKRCGPPLVDADSHAFCQAIFQGVEGPEWDAMYYRYKDLHPSVKNKISEEKTRRLKCCGPRKTQKIRVGLP